MDMIEELREDRDGWNQKYKGVFRSYQENLLENDRLKIEIIELGQTYQNLSINFREFNYKYHEIQQQLNQIEAENQRNTLQQYNSYKSNDYLDSEDSNIDLPDPNKQEEDMKYQN